MTHATTTLFREPVTVNGIVMQACSSSDEHAVRQSVFAELLRQQAVREGYLNSEVQFQAQPIDAVAEQAIQKMLQSSVVVPEALDDDCERYYFAHRSHYVVGQAVRFRHILFAVTSRIDVQALAQRAEEVLLRLMSSAQLEVKFAQLAKEFSNCPSADGGGDLGWITPSDCVPELARWLFYSPDVQVAPGLHPRLVHSRFGLHIVEIQERKAGRELDFAQVKPAVRKRLDQQSYATALKQYMAVLVSQADIQGIAMDESSISLGRG